MLIILKANWVCLVQAYNVFKFWNSGFSYCFPVIVSMLLFVMKNKTIFALKVFNMRALATCQFGSQKMYEN